MCSDFPVGRHTSSGLRPSPHPEDWASVPHAALLSYHGDSEPAFSRTSARGAESTCWQGWLLGQVHEGQRAWVADPTQDGTLTRDTRFSNHGRE